VYMLGLGLGLFLALLGHGHLCLTGCRNSAPIFVPGPIDEASRAIGRLHGPKFGENHLPGGAAGQTGSKNMVSTHFFDSATLTSYSTPIHYGVYLAPIRSSHSELLQ